MELKTSSSLSKLLILNNLTDIRRTSNDGWILHTGSIKQEYHWDGLMILQNNIKKVEFEHRSYFL